MELDKKQFEGRKFRNVHWGSELPMDDFSRRTYEVNESNFWVTSAVDTSEDLVPFTKMNSVEQDVFIKSSIILQQIDKNQSTNGMAVLAQIAQNPNEEMVYAFQSGMETVHSKSYNRISSTIMSTQKEEEYIKWAEDNKYVQRVVNFLFSRISRSAELSKQEGKYLAGYLRTIAYSNAVEGYVFFSLFYQFLRTARVDNRMIKALEIILLIMRDESVHHGYGGVVFNNYFKELELEEEKKGIPVEERETTKIIEELAEDFSLLHVLVNDMIHEMYSAFGEEYKLEVIRYTNYNFNRLLRSLGFNDVFFGDDAKVRAVIRADVEKADTNADNFSMIGNTYYMMKLKPFTIKNIQNVDKLLEENGELVPELVKRG